MKAVRLRTENLCDPIGISVSRPALSWNCQGGIRQSAYRILAVDEDKIPSVVWDSGKVKSDQMAYIPWGGKALSSRSDIRWRVMLWDEEDRPGDWSDEAKFELAIGPDDWKATWIAGNYKPCLRANQALQYLQKPHRRFPVDCFRRKIVLNKEVKKARIYASACGLYEIAIDGVKAGDFCLAPGITDYRKRVQLQTIDVTKAFQKGSGEHVLTAMLADGWYRGSTGAWGLLDQYGTQTKFIAQLELTFSDGSRETVCTDCTWESQVHICV